MSNEEYHSTLAKDITESGTITIADAQRALAVDIQQLAALAVEYKNKRDTAKTSLKREHFNNKLTENNHNAVNLILALAELTEQNPPKEDDNTAG